MGARRGSDVQSGKRRLVEARVLRKRHPQQYVEYPDCTDARRNTGVLAQFDESFVFVDPAELVVRTLGGCVYVVTAALRESVAS